MLMSMQKHKSGRNKGFGFTTFEAEKDLECVLQAGPSFSPFKVQNLHTCPGSVFAVMPQMERSHD